MPKIVGIDLGTTNSVIAVMEGAEPVVISLAEGTRLCPSVVGFTRTGERLVGPLAKRQALAAPERTIRSIKRHMGTDYTVEIDNRRIDAAGDFRPDFAKTKSGRGKLSRRTR